MQRLNRLFTIPTHCIKFKRKLKPLKQYQTRSRGRNHTRRMISIFVISSANNAYLGQYSLREKSSRVGFVIEGLLLIIAIRVPFRRRLSAWVGGLRWPPQGAGRWAAKLHPPTHPPQVRFSGRARINFFRMKSSPLPDVFCRHSRLNGMKRCQRASPSLSLSPLPLRSDKSFNIEARVNGKQQTEAAPKSIQGIRRIDVNNYMDESIRRKLRFKVAIAPPFRCFL